MPDYALAWLLLILMAAGGGIALWRLLHKIDSLVVKSILVGVVVVFFATPAPVPDYPGDYAPAFIVGVFETFFQIEGRPGGALVTLAIALVVGMVVAGLFGRWLQRRRAKT